MIRRTMFAAAATTLLAIAAPAVPASAGGGCHAGVTSGEGTTVEMIDACFTPTTLFVAPGDEVTFVNRDAMVHNVGGNLWGHFDDLTPGDRFRAAFEEEGVYSYACSYHPGMTGTIVVGDGEGAGNGATVATTLGEPPAGDADPAPAAVAAAPASDAADGASSTAAWFGGGAIGFAVGLAGALAWRRRGASRPAAALAGSER